MAKSSGLRGRVIHPQIAWAGVHSYDEADALAAEVCATLKRRGERFESDDELCSWLEEDQVSYTPEGLAAVIGYLEWIGRIKRPRQDQWRSDLPLPGIYVPPRIYPE